MNTWRNLMTAVAGVTALATLAGPSVCAAADDNGFYQRHAEGWFWYEDPPEAKAPKKPKVAPKPKTPVAQAAPKPAEPEPMSAAWLRDNIPKYRDRAIDDPSPTNIRALLYLQRVAMDKASRYTDVTQKVVSGDQVLDEYAQYPQGTGFVQQIQQEAEDLSDRMLRGMAKDTGLMFFFESTCSYCAIQVGVIHTLQRLYGIHVVPISLDGKPLPGNPFPDFIPDRGVAERLNVKVTPTIVLAHPPDGMQVIARGLLSVTELKRRVLAAAAERGWVNVNQYQHTKPSSLHGPDLSDIQLSGDEAADADSIIQQVNARLNSTR